MEIYAVVMDYLKATGMPPSVFGRRSIKDPRLIDDLRNGRDPRPATRARIMAYIAAHPEAYRALESTRGRCSNARSSRMRRMPD